jgi:hypothetical protein
MEIAATKATVVSATERIIAKIMRASAKLPIGISHAASQFLAAASAGFADDLRLNGNLPRKPKAVLVGAGAYGAHHH